MNLKTALITLSVSALLALGLVGCGDECADADDRVLAKQQECSLSQDSPPDESTEVECTEALAAEAVCFADCFEAASCDDIKLVNPEAESTVAYLKCLEGCPTAPK